MTTQNQLLREALHDIEQAHDLSLDLDHYAARQVLVSLADKIKVALAAQPAEGQPPEGFVSGQTYKQLFELNEKNAERILALEDELDALKSAQPAEGGEADTGPRVLREVFALCEATEHALHDECNAHSVQDSTLFSRGRLFEAKSIRKAIGTWFQDEFCGRSFMGEPVATPPASQEQAQQPKPQPMTEKQIGECIDEVMLNSNYGTHHFGWAIELARAIEAHHGITAQAKKETP